MRIALLALLVGCGDGATHTVTITGTTSDAHAISTPAGISCGSTSSNVCTHEFPDGTHLDLLVEQTTGPGGTMTCTFMLPDGTMTMVTAPCSYKVVLEDDLLVTIARRGATVD